MAQPSSHTTQGDEPGFVFTPLEIQGRTFPTVPLNSSEVVVGDWGRGRQQGQLQTCDL